MRMRIRQRIKIQKNRRIMIRMRMISLFLNYWYRGITFPNVNLNSASFFAVLSIFPHGFFGGFSSVDCAIRVIRSRVMALQKFRVRRFMSGIHI